MEKINRPVKKKVYNSGKNRLVMLSQARIKWIRSLKIKKYRIKNTAFIAEGDTIVRDLLQSGVEVIYLLATKTWIETHRPDLRGKGELIPVTTKDLKKVSGLKTPNEVLLAARIPEPGIDPVAIGQELNLALDNIRDPGNLGTIIRTADWFGIPHIFCSDNCADVWNP